MKAVRMFLPLLLLLPAPARAGLATSRVGVLKFEVPSADVNGQVASDFFSTYLIRNYPGVSVVERSQLEKVLKEQQLQYQSGVIDRDTAARLQSVLGVDSLVLGSIVAVDRDAHGGSGSLMITARLVDTTSGQILWADSRTVRLHQSGLKRLFSSGDSPEFITDKLLELAAFELVDDLGKHLDVKAGVAPAAGANAGRGVGANAVVQTCAHSQDRIRDIAHDVLPEESLYWAHRIREEPALNVTPGGSYDEPELRQRLTTGIFLWLDHRQLPNLGDEQLKRLAKAKNEIKTWRSACEQAKDYQLALAN